jgi:hypothetical protein
VFLHFITHRHCQSKIARHKRTKDQPILCRQLTPLCQSNRAVFLEYFSSFEVAVFVEAVVQPSFKTTFIGRIFRLNRRTYPLRDNIERQPLTLSKRSYTPYVFQRVTLYHLRIENPRVGGSNPPPGTTFHNKYNGLTKPKKQSFRHLSNGFV